MQLTIQNKAKYLHVVANNLTSDLNTSDVTVKIHNYTWLHLLASFLLSTLRHHVGGLNVLVKMSLPVWSGLHGLSSFQGLYSPSPQPYRELGHPFARYKLAKEKAKGKSWDCP